MTPEERQQQLDLYRRAYDLLSATVNEYPASMWQFRPAPGRWTIHEILVHITDSEANSYVRCRRLLAEPGSVVLGYDEALWAVKLDYHAQDPQVALQTFRWLRQATYALLKDLPPAAWQNTIYHSENGVMSLDDWLGVYARHIPDHIAQMEAVYVDWLATKT